MRPDMRWQLAISIVARLLPIYALLLVAPWRASRHHPDPARLRDALRLLPGVVRLLRRLAADRTVPQGVRIRLVLLLAYLASPIDLIADLIPVLGYADDAIIVTIGLDSATRRAGRAAIERHWPGTPEGLAALRRLTKLRER